MNGEVMDVITFMMDHVSDLKVDKTINLAYAPYIMVLILAKIRFRGKHEVVHAPFKPFRNEPIFLQRPLTPFPDIEVAALEHEDDNANQGAQDMPPVTTKF